MSIQIEKQPETIPMSLENTTIPTPETVEASTQPEINAPAIPSIPSVVDTTPTQSALSGVTSPETQPSIPTTSEPISQPISTPINPSIFRLQAFKTPTSAQCFATVEDRKLKLAA